MIRTDFLIVGGGFFGSYLSHILKKELPDASVTIVEQENDLFKRASYNNQARIHQGYHYPRSLLTALSSHKNFDRFIREFKGCVVNDFEKYYAIGRIQSKVTANQYKTFCQRIGMPIKPAPAHIKKLFNSDLIEDVFSVKEYAFDAVKLKKIIKSKIQKQNVNVMLNTSVIKIKKEKLFLTELINTKSRKKETITSKYVFICTYANLNTILYRSNIELINLKHEMTEMCLITIPKELKGISVTVMCGPFFSFMPFPPKGKGMYTLSHVRYTPHHYWSDREGYVDNQKYYNLALKKMKTHFLHMKKDISRYIPSAENFKYHGSLWEIKSVLPASEFDDSRPILFKKDVGGHKNLFCILGGKIDNIYDLESEMTPILKKIKKTRIHPLT